MKNKENKRIGILDMTIDNMFLINMVRDIFKNDDIYYISDMNHTNTDVQLDEFEFDDEEKKEKDINDIVSKNLNYLLSKDIDVLVIANDTIIEYCEELIESIKIPIVHIVNETINYINKNYEFKNIGFLACTSIMEANIYQKNFRYNHLYNMNGDVLRDIIQNQFVKTTETFQEVKNIVLPYRKKDLDIIVPSLVNFLMVDVEFGEWVKKATLLPIDKIICDAISHILYGKEEYVSPKKGKGKTYVFLDEDVDKTIINRFVKSKYELININNLQ